MKRKGFLAILIVVCLSLSCISMALAEELDVENADDSIIDMEIEEQSEIDVDEEVGADAVDPMYDEQMLDLDDLEAPVTDEETPAFLGGVMMT